MKNTPIGVLLNHTNMLDSFQNNIIVLIIHVTIASEKKKNYVNWLYNYKYVFNKIN